MYHRLSASYFHEHQRHQVVHRQAQGLSNRTTLLDDERRKGKYYRQDRNQTVAIYCR